MQQPPCHLRQADPGDLQEPAAGSSLELGPLLLVDTTGCEPGEVTNEDGSKSNATEARLAWLHARALVAAGLKPQDLGIISGYSAQVQLPRHLRCSSAGRSGDVLSSLATPSIVWAGSRCLLKQSV